MARIKCFLPIYTSFLANVEEFETSKFFMNEFHFFFFFFFQWNADGVLFHIMVDIVRNTVNYVSFPIKDLQKEKKQKPLLVLIQIFPFHWSMVCSIQD